MPSSVSPTRESRVVSREPAAVEPAGVPGTGSKGFRGWCCSHIPAEEVRQRLRLGGALLLRVDGQIALFHQPYDPGQITSLGLVYSVDKQKISNSQSCGRGLMR